MARLLFLLSLFGLPVAKADNSFFSPDPNLLAAPSEASLESRSRSHLDLLKSACGLSDSYLSQKNKAQTVQIAFIRGFFLDIPLVNNPFAGEKIVSEVEYAAKLAGFSVIPRTYHYNSANTACREMAAIRNSKIILVGHSLGAAGAAVISDCLARQGIQTDLMVHISSFDATDSRVDLTKVPPHVRQLYNFWVTDGVLDGHRNVQALDPSRTAVQNTKVDMNLLIPYAGTHAYVSTRVAPVVILLSLASILDDRALVLEPVLASDVNSRLQDFFSCPQNRTIARGN